MIPCLFVVSLDGQTERRMLERRHEYYNEPILERVDLAWPLDWEPDWEPDMTVRMKTYRYEGPLLDGVTAVYALTGLAIKEAFMRLAAPERVSSDEVEAELRRAMRHWQAQECGGNVVAVLDERVKVWVPPPYRGQHLREHELRQVVAIRSTP